MHITVLRRFSSFFMFTIAVSDALAASKATPFREQELPSLFFITAFP